MRAILGLEHATLLTNQQQQCEVASPISKQRERFSQTMVQMKLRVRGLNGGPTFRVEVPQQCSLEAARHAIAGALASQGVVFCPPIRLSLNKSSEIQGPDSTLLSHFGVTNGDLLFYSHGSDVAGTTGAHINSHKHAVHPNSEFFKQQNEKTKRELCAEAALRRLSATLQSSVGCTSFVNELDSVPQAIAYGQEVKEDLMQTEQSDLKERAPCLDVAGLEKCGHNDALDMAVPVIDTSSNQMPTSIPGILQRVLLAEQKNIMHHDELLLLSVHAVMLETGFKLMNSNGWSGGKTVNLWYTISDLCQLGEVKHVILRSHMVHNTLVVYGSVTNGSMTSKYRLCMQISKYLNGDVLHCNHLIELFSDIFGLWKSVKDGLSLPLMTALCEQAGLPLPSSLSMLPIELKMKILGGLPMVDLVSSGCTCSELRHLAANDELWKRLFIEEFGGSSSQQLAGFCGWKGAFQQKFIERKRLLSRTVQHRPFSYGIPQFPTRRRPRIRFGGMIGGDSDLYPPMSGPPLGRLGGTRGFLGGLHERLGHDGGSID